MKTIQHTLAYVLSCKEYNEDDIRRMVPYVLLPDAIRCFTGPRQYSHFERARNEDDSSWMTFPADMKRLSKEAFAQTESHLCRTDPCVLGEETDLLAFVKHNHDIPDDMFKGVAIHLQQDIIFDEFVRREINCSRMYEDRFVYNGQEVGGKEVRAIISDMEDDGMRVLAGLVHDKFGITADQKWFDRIVKPALDKVYPKAMAESCYKYMKMSPELNYDIQQHVTETELPADRFVEMYADAAAIRGDRNRVQETAKEGEIQHRSSRQYER